MLLQFQQSTVQPAPDLLHLVVVLGNDENRQVPLCVYQEYDKGDHGGVELLFGGRLMQPEGGGAAAGQVDVDLIARIAHHDIGQQFP